MLDNTPKSESISLTKKDFVLIAIGYIFFLSLLGFSIWSFYHPVTENNNLPVSEENNTINYTYDIDTNTILSCPFCDGKAEVKESIFEYEAYVKCTKCNASTDNYNCVSYEEAKQQAIKAWNRRVKE